MTAALIALTVWCVTFLCVWAVCVALHAGDSEAGR